MTSPNRAESFSGNFPGLTGPAKLNAPPKYPSLNVGDEERVGDSVIGRVTTPYGGSTRSEKFHPGVDIANAGGTKIPAFTEGTVASSGKSRLFGNYLVVKDAAGNLHRYSHLKRSFVPVGTPVKRGTPIGEMGATGNVYSDSGGDPSHLDYRIVNQFDQPIDPNQFVLGE